MSFAPLFGSCKLAPPCERRLVSTPSSNFRNNPPGPKTPHKSTLADHPAIAPILPAFIARLAAYVSQIHVALAGHDHAALRQVMHQLKGAGTSFGFAPITDHATAIEQLLLDGCTPAQIQPAVLSLVDYLENVDGYASPQPLTR